MKSMSSESPDRTIWPICLSCIRGQHTRASLTKTNRSGGRLYPWRHQTCDLGTLIELWSMCLLTGRNTPSDENWPELNAWNKALNICFCSSFSTVWRNREAIYNSPDLEQQCRLFGWYPMKTRAKNEKRIFTSGTQGIKIANYFFSAPTKPPPQIIWTVTFHFAFLSHWVPPRSFVSHMWSGVRLSERSSCGILPSRTLGHNALLLMTVARIKACDVSAGVLHWWESGSWSPGAPGPTGRHSPKIKKVQKKKEKKGIVFYTDIFLWPEAQNIRF